LRRLTIGVAALVTVVAVAAASAAAPRLSPGVYTTRITGATPSYLNGTWRIAFNSPGFTVSKNGAAAIVGTVQIVGNKVTFRDRTGPLACSGAASTGTYTWRLAGKRLTFTRVKDSCQGRPVVLRRSFTKIA
jgi:hypothetical protein